MQGPAASVPEVEAALRALANGNRLRLLFALQEPRSYTEIDLPPTRHDKLGSSDRSISRQAIRRHLRSLMKLGLVKQIDPEESGDVTRFVVDRARLFALLEEFRGLATLRPMVEVSSDTVDLSPGGAAVQPKGPHLTLVRGVEEGRAFPLDQAVNKWTVGRSRKTDVPLEYDGFVSSTHAWIERKGDAYFLGDDPGNRNGTILNWEPMQRGAIAPIAAGDVIGVGRSLLVFRA